jgi:hypothetical protein
MLLNEWIKKIITPLDVWSMALSINNEAVNNDVSFGLDFMKNPHRRIPAAQTAGPIH